MCDPEKTDFLPNENDKEIKYNTENNQEKESKLPCWRKIPCIGIALIIVKNSVNGASDVIVKKITDIGKYKLIFYTYLLYNQINLGSYAKNLYIKVNNIITDQMPNPTIGREMPRK